MEVLCVIDSLGPGGAQRQIVELAKGFSEKGYDVSFVIYHDEYFYKPVLESIGISITLIKEKSYLKRIIRVRRHIRQANPNVIIAFLQGSAVLATLAGFPSKRWKLIVGERSSNPRILTSFKLRAYRWLHFFADYIVANSHANLAMVKKANPLLRENKLKVIYNIVNEPLRPAKYEVELEKVRIVVAASYRPVKNLHGLLSAVENLPAQYKNKIEIDWYGNREDRAYSAEMEKLVFKKQLSRIIKMHPVNSAIFERYREADFVALFSHHEGFPNTVCEAMSMGLPVIVSRVSDIPRFVKEDVNGFLCDPHDIETITNALIKSIECCYIHRIEMGRNNVEIAKTYFNKEDILQKYIELM